MVGVYIPKLINARWISCGVLRYVAAPAVRLRICHIEAAAQARPAGYLDDVMSAGVRDGEWLEIPDPIYVALVEKYRPSSTSLAGQAISASVRWLTAGAQVTPEALHHDRSAVCAMCPLWDARRQRCMQCGCYAAKLWLATERCPIGRW